MASNTASGEGAFITGRPMTTWELPFSKAIRGVVTRFWSSKAVPSGRTPGVTRVKCPPNSRRNNAVSNGEQTSPFKPANLANRARVTTSPPTVWSNPIWVRSSSSKLVSTVTASSWVRCGQDSRAASIMARPPRLWMVRNFTSNEPAAATALATVLGISWNFRSKKTSAPSARTRRTRSAPPRL